MENGGQAVWTQVDNYFGDLLVYADNTLDDALLANERAGLPQIDVTRLQGKFLEFLVRISGARCILEIGTLGGYSTIWLARALPPDGHLVTLEVDPKHAELAQANLDRAGLSGLVEIRVGPAVESLAQLYKDGVEPFDMVFIDADKPSNPAYLGWALKLANPGALILTDNVVREGEIVDAGSEDPSIQGTRRMFDMLAAEPRLSATAIQTVGSKGYDGFAMAVVVKD